jgi:hypothetical protein
LEKQLKDILLLYNKMNRFLVPLLLLTRDNAFYVPIFKHSVLVSHHLFDKPKDTIKFQNPDVCSCNNGCNSQATHLIPKPFIGTCIRVLDLNDSVDFHEMTLDDRIDINMIYPEVYSYWDYHLDILNLQPTSLLFYDENNICDNEEEYLDKEKDQYEDDCFEDNCDL